jgi:hypothetical protein
VTTLFACLLLIVLLLQCGHYLGLMHTHESSQPCDVLGADDVTDTPPNQQIDAYADAAGNLAELSGNNRTASALLLIYMSKSGLLQFLRASATCTCLAVQGQRCVQLLHVTVIHIKCSADY